MALTRRALLQQLSLTTATCAFAAPDLASTAGTPPEEDWRWLEGNWDVWHERLRERLVGCTTWDNFGGKCSSWPTLGGLGNVDDCLLYLPSGTYRAMAPRSFDPVTAQWNIWWLDGRMADKLDPPVRGGFSGAEGEFQGADVHKGTPVTARFRWHAIHSKRPWWDQSFTTDGGKSWEVNWRNYFTRTQATATPVPLDAGEKMHDAAGDWAFLAGQWRVRNRRQKADGSWEEFASSLSNRSTMSGLGNVGDNQFQAPGGTYRGLSMRSFDLASKLWRSWWLDGRTPREIAPALTGKFDRGTGILVGDDVIRGEKVRIRSRWSDITANSARWEQAFSRDGQTWDINWSAELERQTG